MKNLLIIFGGKSAEHHVSVKSGLSIMGNINYEDYNVDVLYSTIEGRYRWLDTVSSKNDAEKLASQFKTDTSSHVTFNLVDCVSRICRSEVVFSLLHGRNGEDGVVQGFLELLGIAYVGSAVTSSAITMNKILVKKILESSGVKVVPYLSFSAHDAKQHIFSEISKYLDFPLFIKPANFGSSIGVSRARKMAELEDALTQVFAIDNQVVVEKEIIGQEISVAVLENIDGSLTISPPGEIQVQSDFYSYETKYLKKGSSVFIVPAVINIADIKTLTLLTSEIFKFCECSGMARLDYFIEKRTGILFFNEINTIPGFTNSSLYPLLFAKTPLNISKIVDNLITVAIKNKNKKLLQYNKERTFLKKSEAIYR
jgi:D-alanine-D-alanine ligase